MMDKINTILDATNIIRMGKHLYKFDYGLPQVNSLNEIYFFKVKSHQWLRFLNCLYFSQGMESVTFTL